METPEGIVYQSLFGYKFRSQIVIIAKSDHVGVFVTLRYLLPPT